MSGQHRSRIEERANSYRPRHLQTKEEDLRTTYGESVDFHDTNSLANVEVTVAAWRSPDARWRKLWDVLQAVVLFYLATAVPLRVGFDRPAAGWMYVLDLAIDLYFWIDIFFNFVLAYENNEGVHIYDLKKIRMNYLKHWFLIDVVASLPIDMVMRMINSEFVCSIKESCDTIASNVSHHPRMLRLVKLVRVLRLMKLLRLARVQRILDRYQDLLFPFMSLIQICKLLLILVFLGHIIGCFFYFFSTKEWRSQRELIRLGTAGSWIESNGIEKGSGAPLVEMYSVASYWAFTTMTTVGYGDISATTQAERIWAILGMIIGGFVFSGLVGAMAKLINTQNLSRQAYNGKMDLVGAFVRDLHMPAELRLRVLRFFRRQEVHAYNEHDMLCQLPFQERMDLLWHCYGGIVMRVPVFRDTNGIFLGEMMSSLEPMNLQAGTMIVLKGQAASHMYLIAKGVIELLCDDGETVFRYLHLGSYFGEDAVFTDKHGLRSFSHHDPVYSENARVSAGGGNAANAKLLKLSRKAMQEALEGHQEVLKLMQKEHLERRSRFEKAKVERCKQASLGGHVGGKTASPYFRKAVMQLQAGKNLGNAAKALVQIQAEHQSSAKIIPTDKPPTLPAAESVTPGPNSFAAPPKLAPISHKGKTQEEEPEFLAGAGVTNALLGQPASGSKGETPERQLLNPELIEHISTAVAKKIQHQMDQQFNQLQQRLGSLEKRVGQKLDHLALAVEAGGNDEVPL